MVNVICCLSLNSFKLLCTLSVVRVRCGGPRIQKLTSEWLRYGSALKSGAGQNMALCALPAARQSGVKCVPVSAFPVQLMCVFPSLNTTCKATNVNDASLVTGNVCFVTDEVCYPPGHDLGS